MKKILVVTILLFTSYLAFPIMYANEGNCAFTPNDCGQRSSGLTMISGVSLKTLINQGATYFFDSLSNYNKFLKAYEVNDYFKMKIYMENATIQMKLAHNVYIEFNKESLNYDYNDTVIERLKNFEYDEYKMTFQLMEPVFTKVTEYLLRGDVRGAFREIERITGEISSDMGSLNLIQCFPEKSVVWRLTQKIIEAQLFGQYLAEIFCQVN